MRKRAYKADEGEHDCPDCKGVGARNCTRCAGLGRIYVDANGDESHTAPPCDCGCESWIDSANGKVCGNCGTPVEGRI